MSTLISFIIGTLISGVGVSYYEPARTFFSQAVPYVDAVTALASTGNFTSATCSIAATPLISPRMGAPVQLTFTLTNRFSEMSFNGERIENGYTTTVYPTDKTTYTALLNGVLGCQYTVDIADGAQSPVCAVSADVAKDAAPADVSLVQQFLIDMQYPIVKSGVYDTKTETAVKLYQMEVLGVDTKNLRDVVTGVWDKQTRDTVQKLLGCGAAPVSGEQKAVHSAEPVAAGAADDKVCLDKFIRPRAQGDEVNALQQFLQKQGFVLDATGFYGEKTKQAVKDFQEAFSDDILKPNDLTAGNGIWGPSTAKKASSLGLCSFVK